MSSREEEEDQEEKNIRKECEELLPTLPKAIPYDGRCLYFHNGFWNLPKILPATIALQNHFKPQHSDIILATMPKSGTTWLKALTFATVNRAHGGSSPLLTASPHDLVPFLELDLYLKTHNPNLESIPSPRIFTTHIPYNSLPPSLRNSSCKIVYLCRNPLDHFISYWQFMPKVRSPTRGEITFEEAFDNFCRGISAYGPVWDNVLGYWKASQEELVSKRVLFMKYEDMKDDIVSHLKTLAHFLECPFSAEEEEEGVVEQVAKLCSFENLKTLEANKTGETATGAQHSFFFRKGEVGDWVNYLTPSMADRIKKVTADKFEGSGLSFKFS